MLRAADEGSVAEMQSCQNSACSYNLKGEPPKNDLMRQTSFSLIPMLQAMDYKILIVPSDRRVREDEYEVSGSEKKAKPDKVDLDALLGTEAPSPVSKNGKIKLPKTPKPEVEEK